MWAELKKLVKDCITEIDGQTYCPFRVGGVALTSVSLPTFIALAVFSVWKDPAHHFDMIAFGTAFGAMMTGIALLTGGVAIKARGELKGDSGNA
jgi:hypothetical protein